MSFSEDQKKIELEKKTARAEKIESQAEAREVRTDAREVRTDAREVRVDTTTERLWKGVRMLIWISCVLVVLLVGSIARSFIVQDQVDEVDEVLSRTEAAAIVTGESAENAKISADATLKELRAAIAALNSPSTEPDLSNQAVISALEAITRIEAFLCNGVCPDP